MAFRIKAAASLIFVATLSAQEFAVRHDHLRKGGEGTLRFTAEGVTFEEAGKKASHSRAWKYAEIQRFDLSPERLRILTYEDVRARLDADREYVFSALPKDMARTLYPLLSRTLDQRFVARIANPVGGQEVLWTSPAKMLHGRAGANGVLRVEPDQIVFESDSASRTWRYSDVHAITTENSYELTVVSLDSETRFQLKTSLPEERYNSLWRRIEEANGLKPFHSALENHHD